MGKARLRAACVSVWSCMIKTAALACSYCEASFPSRNELFRHLRDTKTECGDKVAQQGGIAFGAGRKKSRTKVTFASNTNQSSSHRGFEL